MNREEIIRRLKEFPYDPGNYWLLDGAAKVMYGEETGASHIRIGCLTEMADQLEAHGAELLKGE